MACDLRQLDAQEKKEREDEDAGSKKAKAKGKVAGASRKVSDPGVGGRIGDEFFIVTIMSELHHKTGELPDILSLNGGSSIKIALSEFVRRPVGPTGLVMRVCSSRPVEYIRVVWDVNWI